MARGINPDPGIITYTSWQLFKDLLKFINPYKGRFILASIIRLAGDLAYLYPVYALATVVTFLSNYQQGTSLKIIWITLGLWMLATITRNLSQFFTRYFGFQVAEKIGIDASLQTVQHMFALNMSWHEQENSGNKIKRIQNAADSLNRIIRIWFNSIIEIMVNFVAITLILYKFDARVVGLVVVFLISYFIISSFMTKRAGHASYRVNTQEEEVNGILFEAINNVRTVKVMAMTKSLFNIITFGMDDLMSKLRNRIIWYQSRDSGLSFWSGAWKIGILAMIVIGVVNGRYEVGFLILFNGYFSDLKASIDELSTATQDFITAKFAIARMQVILDEPITIDKEDGKVRLPQNWQKITLNNLSFAYGENKVLNNISLEIKRGQKIGIVGLSGAGKSTLFKLLLKEHEGFAGDILFDNTSIKTISKNDYFKNVSVVLQDTEVFNMSLQDNITLSNSKQKTNQKLLQQALNTSHTNDFISKLPEGLKTVIGEKGVKLSGGERQRLGLARAIFKQPQILLLDEATSHLDLESEAKIQDSLHKFFNDVTAIVIAHRLTTIKEMDQILVLQKGRIIESGNFQELYAKKGRFYELWEKQRL